MCVSCHSHSFSELFRRKKINLWTHFTDQSTMNFPPNMASTTPKYGNHYAQLWHPLPKPYKALKALTCGKVFNAGEKHNQFFRSVPYTGKSGSNYLPSISTTGNYRRKIYIYSFFYNCANRMNGCLAINQGGINNGDPLIDN